MDVMMADPPGLDGGGGGTGMAAGGVGGGGGKDGDGDKPPGTSIDVICVHASSLCRRTSFVLGGPP